MYQHPLSREPSPLPSKEAQPIKLWLWLLLLLLLLFPLPYAQRRGESGRGTAALHLHLLLHLLLLLLLLCAFDVRAPSAATELADRTPHGATCRTHVVFRRYMDVSSKNPGSGVDLERAARKARRQGVLSLGHLSLHKQRKVCSRAEGGRKPLILIRPLILTLTAIAARAESGARARAFTPLRGASHFSLLVQRKSNQKKAHPASAPTPLRDADPLRRRDFSTIHPCIVEKRRTSMCAAPFGV